MRHIPRSTVLLLVATTLATPGCATMYVSKTADFTRERSSDIVAVNRAAIDGDTLFVDLAVRNGHEAGTREVTLRLPLSELTGELRFRKPTRAGLLHSWSRVDDRTRIARVSSHAVRERGRLPERARPLPLQRVGFDDFMVAALAAPTGAKPEVHVVTTASPPSTLLGVVLARPAWVGTEQILISGIDEENPRAASYVAWGGAFIVDVVMTQLALGTVFCLLGGCY
jgi:hypothetical protein